MTVDLQQIMDNQQTLQIALGGNHPSERSGPEIADHIREMVLACTNELHESLNEVQWKTWAAHQGRIDREPYVAELVDALQFLMNLFSVVHCNAEEIERKLSAKHEINWQRLRDGYTGLNKCLRCKRALDDEAVKCTATHCVIPVEIV